MDEDALSKLQIENFIQSAFHARKKSWRTSAFQPEMQTIRKVEETFVSADPRPSIAPQNPYYCRNTIFGLCLSAQPVVALA